MKKPLPVDRGWAWVVCCSVFMIAFLTLTGGQVNAVGFLDMVKELDTSVTTLSISVTVQLFAASIFALITVNVFVPFFGERRVIATGAFVSACASIGISQSPNVYVFIIFCLVKGGAGGSYFVPCVALVGHYFNKRRSLATTISICGTSVASISAPRLVRWCVDEFGIRGTYLLLGAVELNMIIFALLLRPVSSYGPPLPEAPEAVNLNDNGEQKQPEVEMKHLQTDSKLKNPQLEEVRKIRSVSFDSVDVTPTPEEHAEERENEVLLNKDDEDLSHEKKLPSDDQRSHGVEPNGRSCAALGSPTDHDREDEGLEHHNLVRTISTASSGSSWSKSNRRPRLLERGQSVWSMMSGGQGSQAGIAAPLELDADDIMSLSKMKAKEPACSKLRNVFDLSLFREWRFCFLAIGDLLASSNSYLFGYFPTIVVFQGVTKDEAATLQTIMGAVDLVGRLVMGFIADNNRVRPSQVSATGLLWLALMCHVVPYFTSFKSMIGISLGLGLFIGTRQSLSPVVYTEVMGIARMSKSYSVSILMIAAGAAAHSAFLSAIMESTNSTRIVWHYIGSVLLIYVIILYCLPLIHKVEMKFKGQTLPENEKKIEANTQC